jgi:3-hydroxyacyl-CoA dehydrogenase
MILETEGASLAADPRGWRRLQIKGDPPRIGDDVLTALEAAVTADDPTPVVIVSAAEAFALGADLDREIAAAMAGDLAPMEAALVRYQAVMLAVQRSPVPVVAAVGAIAISGGCELVMHCAGAAAHREAPIGLREAYVGVVPGGGGLKELARRAADAAPQDRPAALARAFAMVGTGRLRLAEEAQARGFMAATPAVFTDGDVEAEAGRRALALRHGGYAPPPARPIPVGGQPAFEALQAALGRRAERDGLTAHQVTIATEIARVLTAADLGADAVDEQDLLALERRAFARLLPTPETQAMIRKALAARR